jgi:hypothetical protein
MRRLVLCWIDYSREGVCYFYGLVPFAVVEVNDRLASVFKFNLRLLAQTLHKMNPQVFPSYFDAGGHINGFWRSVVVVNLGDVVDEYVVRYLEEKRITEEKRELLRYEVEREVMEFLNSLPCYRVG